MKPAIGGHRLKAAVLSAFCLLLTGPLMAAAGFAGQDLAAPPDHTVKLIFIHHSCGENWLADDNGELGMVLGQNNYFVSDTNYGWGPQGIGDHTDIADWPRWFSAGEPNVTLNALYRENGRHAPYTRRLRDPGGENQVVMFKSCFPNSNLRGRPNDPPRSGDGLTVSNAKAVYRDLLVYFRSRPDKLFIAVTAPPVRDQTFAANARAFNRWLVDEWLKGYAGTNVAVFDFYNVLTAPDHHHWLRNGNIEHVVATGRNTLYYPSDGDDHPSSEGNRKATGELVPLINAFYHRWQAAQARPAPAAKQDIAEAAATAERDASASEALPTSEAAPDGVDGAEMIDDFEGDRGGWAVFSDETNPATRLTFRRDTAVRFKGKAGMQITYAVASESWATCSRVYAAPRDWRGKKGLTLYLHSERSGQPLQVVVYQGNSAENLSHFEYRVVLTDAHPDGWQRIDIPWQDFRQAAWEGDGSARFDPRRAMGVALAFNGSDSAGTEGVVWVDEVGFLAD